MCSQVTACTICTCHFSVVPGHGVQLEGFLAAVRSCAQERAWSADAVQLDVKVCRHCIVSNSLALHTGSLWLSTIVYVERGWLSHHETS